MLPDDERVAWLLEYSQKFINISSFAQNFNAVFMMLCLYNYTCADGLFTYNYHPFCHLQ